MTILFVLPPLLTGIIWLYQQPRRWHHDLFVSLLLLFALIKPNVSAPFFWIVLFISPRILSYVALGYIGLTFWAVSFQADGLLPAIQGWLAQASTVAAVAGYGNIHIWLSFLGYDRWNFALSLIVLLGLGLWVYRHRQADRWILLGVAALVSRLWTYHRLYEDLLILVPLIALFGIVRQEQNSNRRGVVPALLLVLGCLAMLAPGTLLRLPFPWGTPFRIGQSLLWVGMLLFLLYWPEQAIRGGSKGGAPLPSSPRSARSTSVTPCR